MTSKKFKRRFLREARAVSQLQHPNVCTIHDIGSEEGVDFLVMEYVEGETLQARPADAARPHRRRSALGRRDPPRRSEPRTEKGIVHRDLKPGNIMLTRRRGARCSTSVSPGHGELSGPPRRVATQRASRCARRRSRAARSRSPRARPRRARSRGSPARGSGPRSRRGSAGVGGVDAALAASRPARTARRRSTCSASPRGSIERISGGGCSIPAPWLVDADDHLLALLDRALRGIGGLRDLVLLEAALDRGAGAAHVVEVRSM